VQENVLSDVERNMLLESLSLYQDEVERLNKITTGQKIPLKQVEGLRRRIINAKYVVLKDKV